MQQERGPDCPWEAERAAPDHGLPNPLSIPKGLAVVFPWSINNPTQNTSSEKKKS